MMENFAQHDLKDFVDADQPLTNYYGIYVKKIESFKIVCGHRVLLQRLSGRCKELLQENAVGIKRKPQNKNVPDTDTTSLATDDSLKAKNVTAVEKKLLQTIKTNIKSLVGEKKIELKEKHSEALENLVVQVKKSTSGSGKSEFETKIPCIFCVQQVSGYYAQGRWIIGNYTRHLSTVHRTRGSAPMEAFVVVVDPSIVHLNRTSSSENENEIQFADPEIDNVTNPKKRKVDPADSKAVGDTLQNPELSTIDGKDNEKNF